MYVRRVAVTWPQRFPYNQGDMPLLRRRFVYEIVTNQEILPPFLGGGLTAGPMFPPCNAPAFAGAPLAAPGGGVTIFPADLVISRPLSVGKPKVVALPSSPLPLPSSSGRQWGP